MRIGLVIESLVPQRGGAEHWTWQFAGQLARAGHEVHAIAGQFASGDTLSGVTRHLAPAGGTRVAFAQSLAESMKGLDLDVVHDMGSGLRCDVFQPHGGSRVAAFEQNLRLLPAWMRPLKRQAARWLPRYRDFDELSRAQYRLEGKYFIALSHMVARDLQRFHNVPRRQIRLVYNGVDTQRFSPDHRSEHRGEVRRRLGVRPDETLILIVAHNFRLKGVHILLAATGRLVAMRRAVRLVVVGGRPSQAWKRRAERAGAADVTTFTGPVTDAVPYYAAADVYAQPTFYDPCSLVLLEALASGLPAITSRLNGAGELLTEGKEGHVVRDPADSEELVQRLLPLLDPAVREPMAIAARELALQHTLERNCRELMDVYQEIVSSRRMAA